MSLICVGPTKKYRSPMSVFIGISYTRLPFVKITKLFDKFTLMFTVSPVWNCQP